MSENPRTIKFTACEFLNFDRKSFVPQVKMNLISLGGTTKICWERHDPEGRLKLVQFCKKRGRLNNPEACHNQNAPFVCGYYRDFSHAVPIEDVELD